MSVRVAGILTKMKISVVELTLFACSSNHFFYDSIRYTSGLMESHSSPLLVQFHKSIYTFYILIYVTITLNGSNR